MPTQTAIRRSRLRKTENTMATILCAKARSVPFALPALLAGLLLTTTPPGHAADNGPIVLGDYVTVLTLSRDGSWGTATDTSVSRAIAFAIRDCKAMSQRVLGCGAMFTTVRAGWSLALLCGDETIIAAATERAEAERIAIKREIELREVYHRDMPPCVRLATVNPDGIVIAPPVNTSVRR
jgi:hypothetical protein